jgi:glyoxylase-like metal-dependent hydrolase (beta-lactamase superfamily II)
MTEVQSYTYNPFQENTYVLINAKRECIIIDPGCYFEEERAGLVESIRRQKLKPVRLLNTHTHIDHIMGNRLMAATFGLGLEIHALDQPVLDASQQAGAMYNIPFEPSPPPAGYLREQDEIIFGEATLQVLFTPGHSPGSIAFYSPSDRFVIGGDVLFRESIGRTDLPGGDYPTLIASIRNKLFVLDDEVKVYPGHGPVTTIGYEKANNPFLNGSTALS